jgi:hypothetical protein
MWSGLLKITANEEDQSVKKIDDKSLAYISLSAALVINKRLQGEWRFGAAFGTVSTTAGTIDTKKATGNNSQFSAAA